MVSSLDGFIAKKDNSVSWMESHDHYEPGLTLTDEDIAKFLESIDCYIMGSITYQHALDLGWPYGDVPVTVLSSQNLSIDKESVSIYSGSIDSLISELINKNYQNIWVVGGSKVAREFLRKGLIDEIVISVLPILLGEGLPFFDHIGAERRLHLIDVKAYKDGMVEIIYRVANENIEH